MSLVESFTSAPPQRQLAFAGAAAAAIFALLLAVYFVAIRKPYEVLFTDLRAMDAATIVAELDKQKVPYRLEDGGATILVPEDLVDGTRLSVMGSDLPLKGVVGFELFNKSDMGLTEFAQRINYQRALQGELARTIMTMEAVDTARVHLSLSESAVFREDRVPPKASVTILTRPGEVLAPGAVLGIQRLVAAAIPELQLANVVVLNKRGEVLSRTGAPMLAASPILQARRAIEEYYASRVQIALLRVLPAEAVEVTVTAAGLGALPALDGWNPASRDFGLSVRISSSVALGEQELLEARSAASEAIGFDPTLGDTVSLDLSPAVASTPIEATAAPEAIGEESRRLDAGRLSMLNLGLALVPPLLLLLIAAIFLERRRTGLRVLTTEQREAHTQKLKALLERRDADAAV